MKIKKKWIWNIIGFTPVILFGFIGWILDGIFRIRIWSIYWFLGFFGAYISAVFFACFVLKRTRGERDEENKEDEENNE